MNVNDYSAEMFGQELRRARLKAEMTQEQLAAKARLTREYVSLLELDKRTPTIPVFIRLCKALGISAAKMLTKLEDHDGTTR